MGTQLTRQPRQSASEGNLFVWGFAKGCFPEGGFLAGLPGPPDTGTRAQKKERWTPKKKSQRAPNPPEVAQPRLSRVKARFSPVREYKFGCVCSYMAGHYPGIIMTGHIGTNTPKFVRWGRPRLDPAQTGLCKFGWVWSSLKGGGRVGGGVGTGKGTGKSMRKLCRLELCHAAHTNRVRGQKINTNSFCTKFFGNPSGHGRPRRKSWTTAPKSAFSCGPAGGEKLFDRVRNVRGKSGPKSLCLRCFFFPEKTRTRVQKTERRHIRQNHPFTKPPFP